MDKETLGKEIYDKALSCGFANCGVIPIGDMDGFQPRLEERMGKTPRSAPFYQKIGGIAKVRERFPWARSMVVCTFRLGNYKMPEKLRDKYGKAFLLSPGSDQAGRAYQERLRFEDWLTERGFQWAGGEKTGHVRVGSLRYAAVMAGLGIIRKNNFFYDEEGSYVELEGYVIDQPGEWKQSVQVKPCPEHCTLCMKACKTRSLSAPYTMDPVTCVSFLSTFGGGKVPPLLDERAFDQWICGCDACQDACPFNRHDWDQGEDFPGLPELVELLQPEELLKAPDQVLAEKVLPKMVGHVSPDQLEAFRINSRRALRNRGPAVTDPPGRGGL